MAPHAGDEDYVCPLSDSEDAVWDTIRREAADMMKEDSGELLEEDASQLLPAMLHCSILKWDKLHTSLAFYLASKLHSPLVHLDKLFSLLSTAFSHGTSSTGESIHYMIRKDLLVIKERDPACPSLAHAFLHFKGFQGIQVYRVANWLWWKGQKSLASVLQSRMSEVFGMDIHPAAQIGWGIMIDHATGVVIGETAIVGHGCTLLHGVTLGGTGKQHGDRHPKLGENVLVGAGASILGNVKIGDCAKIGASAVVLNDIPAFATAVGCPAKVIGRTKEENPASGLNHACSLVKTFLKRSKYLCPFQHLDPLHCQGVLQPCSLTGQLQEDYGMQVSSHKTMEILFDIINYSSNLHHDFPSHMATNMHGSVCTDMPENAHEIEKEKKR